MNRLIKTVLALVAVVLLPLGLVAPAAQAAPGHGVHGVGHKVPSAPLNVHWEMPSPVQAMPVWDPPAKTRGEAVTMYWLTLYTTGDVNLVERMPWPPDRVGVDHFGCLGNGFPGATIWSSFTVAAENANGVGPESVLSSYLPGNPCPVA